MLLTKIPKRYEDVSYRDVPENIRALFEQIKETRKGMYIHGGVGSGKTHIAYALLRATEYTTEYLDTEITGEDGTVRTEKRPTRVLADGAVLPIKSLLWNTPRLIDTLKKNFNKSEDFSDDQDEPEYLFDFYGLLFLDDLGAEKMSEWVAEQFYLILNFRYEAKLPTIITSNYSLGELSERLGDRIASRIAEMCDVVKIDGKDRRLK